MQTSHKPRPGAKSKLEQGIRGLYVVADTRMLLEADTTVADFIQGVAQAIKGGASLVQLRHKSDVPLTNGPQTSSSVKSIALELQKLCGDHGVIFIINDDVHLAATIQADGVHLGQKDMPINDARKIMGDRAIIGISCYNQLSLAELAQSRGADYVAFGSFFSSPTKPDAVCASLALAREANDSLTLPIVAIGGITPDNAEPLIATGVSAIAAASGVFHQDDVEATARAYCKLF